MNIVIGCVSVCDIVKNFLSILWLGFLRLISIIFGVVFLRVVVILIVLLIIMILLRFVLCRLFEMIVVWVVFVLIIVMCMDEVYYVLF